MIGGSLLIHENDVLTGFQLPALTAVDVDLTVTSNAALAQCLVEALVGQVVTGGAVVTSENVPGCLCEEIDGAQVAICP